ncbi:MAG TPA: hypothetical protein VHK01_06090 [Lacipirellulaceae bacterium]|jgi:predicted DNA-binding antitoxin AbrB/MazE fold protein|nr:hypothetical protein [Lacipirellulaceae bacterium]
MTIDIDATYRDGALHPETPLNLPENTPVRLRLIAKNEVGQLTKEQIAFLRPKSPRITPEEFRARIAKYAIKAHPLPPDFTREDIYSDHD